MSDTAPSPAKPAAGPSQTRAESKAERIERQARMLRELAAITMSIARAEEQIVLARAAQAMNAAEAGRPAPPQPRGGEASAPIARISRAVRLTLAMENRLYDELEAEQTTAVRKPEPSAQKQKHAEAGIRGLVLSATIAPLVEQAIAAAEDPAGDGSDTERRLDHLGERLADEDEIVSIGTLPIGASLARLCAALGLTPDWSLWEHEDWAIEEARADAPGSPYGRGWAEDQDEDADDERPEAAELAEADANPP
jgi:hypothetical protein